MRKVLNCMAVAVWFVLILAPVSGASAAPLRGVMIQDDTITILGQAHEGSTIALVGTKFNPSDFTQQPFIAVFSEQTGAEIWRRIGSGTDMLMLAAIAQGRVCVAGAPSMGETLFLGCYGAKDGAVLWEETFDRPPMVFYPLTPISLTLTGKGLVVQTGRRADQCCMMGQNSPTLLLDPADGSAIDKKFKRRGL